MAGMLPGVESARRRRLHLGGSSVNSQSGWRRSSFCLYTPGLDAHLSLSSLPRSSLGKGFHGGELGNVAREAKERLDEKLRSQRSTDQIKRHNSNCNNSNSSVISEDGESGLGGAMMISGNYHVEREVFSKKQSSRTRRRRKFSWSKMGWKAPLLLVEEEEEEEDCAVCLDDFKTGDVLVHLPCSHRFHWTCAVPWLQRTSHCPCCRVLLTS